MLSEVQGVSTLVRVHFTSASNAQVAYTPARYELGQVNVKQAVALNPAGRQSPHLTFPALRVANNYVIYDMSTSVTGTKTRRYSKAHVIVCFEW